MEEVKHQGEAGLEEEAKANEGAEVATDVHLVEGVELEQLVPGGKGRAVVELLDRLELVVHEDAVRVRVEADVVHPDEPGRDVVLDLAGVDSIPFQISPPPHHHHTPERLAQAT